jgi:hypothetical protein
VILPRNTWSRWLGNEAMSPISQNQCCAAHGRDVAWPVSQWLCNAKKNNRSLIEPV